MKRYFFILGILILLVPLLFLVTKTPEYCNCNGIGSTYCLGTISCEQEITCIPLTCENKQNLLGEIDVAKDTSLIYTILIIDTSKSMEGENLEATKKAANSFVQQIQETQFVSIIEFNDRATILSEFTNNKEELVQGVQLLNPRGRTEFYKPFSLANELFQDVPEGAKKYVLFLSDGAPEDESTLFMPEIQKLKESDVNIYAVAFQDKSNEKVMKEIASKNENLFLVSTSQDIIDKFSQIYATILEEGDIIIEYESINQILTTTSTIKTKIFSVHNNQNILTQTIYCPISSSNYLEVKKEGIINRILGEKKDDSITYNLESLSTGTYDLVANTRIELDSCTLRATQHIGNIQIVKENECEVSCEDIEAIMRGGKETSNIRKGHKAISWIILIDQSSSMDSFNHLEKAITDTQKAISLMPAYDTLTLGTFDTKTTILQNQILPLQASTERLNQIVPSSSTNVLVALQKAKEYDTAQSHTIIITDGKYSITKQEQLRSLLETFQGCISTINYGTHLLTAQEPVHELIKEYRTCGIDIITQPSSEELQNLINSTSSDQPELLIRIQQEETNMNQTSYRLQTISSFTGKVPKTTTECIFTPKQKLELMDESSITQTISGNTFNTPLNTSFKITSSFSIPECNYETSKTVTFEPPTKKNKLITIISIVALVLITHFFVFLLVVNHKLKRLEKKIKKK